MKFVIIADTHFGVRNDSQFFLNSMNTFLIDTFFKYIDQNGIDTVVHLGDLVDRRKYINFYTLKRLRSDFLQRVAERNLNLHIIAGNHDTFFKSTNDVNALSELLSNQYSKFNVIYDKPSDIIIDDCSILMVPWINEENRNESIQHIKNTKSQICFGHFELNGFEMYRGHINTHGEDPSLLNKFDVVCSGHYHHKSSGGNIHYLGSPLQFTWSDYDDPRGFHEFDTRTREIKFIKNPIDIFKKVVYNDKDRTIKQLIEEFNFSEYKDSITKIIVQEKTNPYWFDIFLEKLEKAGAVNPQVVEDHHNLDKIDDNDIVKEAEDTLTVFNKFIDQLDESATKPNIKKIVNELYNEAMMME